MKKRLAAIITLVIMGTIVTNSCSTGNTSVSLPTSQNQHPIEIVSVVGPVSPINPGGPNVEITLKNAGNVPVVTLAAALQINNVLNKPFNFNFDVSAANPLLLGSDISSKFTLIGGGFSNDVDYPLEISGSLQSGEKFDYKVQVKITQPLTTTSTSILPANPGKTTAVGTNSNGLSLTLTTNATYNFGDQITITVDETNSLITENNVKAANGWPVKGLNLGHCGTINYPFGIIILQGDYEATNLSSIAPLQLYDPGAVYNCPMVLAGITSYDFQPASDVAAIFTGDNSQPLMIDMTTTVTASGSWSGTPEAILSNFSRGTYTVVGGDEWGTLAILHFTIY